MEMHKQRLGSCLLDRNKIPLEFLMSAMFSFEMKIRNCYDKPFKNFTSQEFMEMMLLDGCFILELLNVAANGITECGYNSDDPLFTPSGILPFIKRDLLMLENQLPLFVLNKLFRLSQNKKEVVDELALKFFDSVLPELSKHLPEVGGNKQSRLHLLDVVRQALRPSSMCTPSQANSEDKQFDSVLPELSQNLPTVGENEQSRPHLLDVVRQALRLFSMCTSSQANSQDKQPFQIAMHTVTRLRRTNVVFKKKESTKFTDIKFERGVLNIPPIAIHDSSKSIFLNLMVFEQYYPQCSNYVTSYVGFMDGLINSAKDVEYLYEKEIIMHSLGSDEHVASLFNNLRKEIVFDTNHSYLADVSKRLNEHSIEKWHIRKAILRHEYLKDPWKIISILAAAFLILLTLAQTVYTILGYHRPPS